AKMKPFLFGSRLGHTIFDLDITAFHLRQALNFIAHVAYNDGIILFISRNPQYTLHVENLAKELKEFSITRTWKHGLFTNAYISYGC
ncbi:uS2m family ribosomal protein, partial [Klebsiella pneumoniae]|nr:uS2m family ribosomal protein [Klebsiella pneumoniae]